MLHVWNKAALCAAVSLAAGVVCASPACAQQGRELDYDLPAQELARSLREVSVRSGVGIIAPAELVAGRPGAPLRGRYSVEAAVERLIAGTGLRAERVGEGLVISGAAASGRQAAEGGGPSDEIVVTGTNVRGAQPTSQVLTISREDVEESGRTSVEELMRTLPQNSNGGVGQENFGLTGAGADITEHGAGVNLRGLGQRATLVLLNGRRVAPSGSGSFVDLSLIPVSALERVEVLTDGASAIYGSDAVGGVVNFILRDRFEGFEASLLAGSATKGDGDQLQAALAAGTGWSGGSAMLAYEYRREDEVLARDRDFTINLRPDSTILPRERRHSLFGAATHDLTDRLSIEITGLHSRRDTKRSYFFQSSPILVDTRADARSTGLSGALRYELGGDWVAELAGGWSRTRTEQTQVQSGGQGPINDRSVTNRIADLGLKVDGALLDLPGGPVRIALGVQGRRETYVENFATSINTPTEQRKRRDVKSVFGEVYVPLFSRANRIEGIERLALTGAVRYESYDAFGSTVDPKLGLLWSPFRGLTLRTSYDTSFRAPLLSESTAFFNAFYLPTSILRVGPGEFGQVALVLAGSNPDVGPERSRTWTIGAEVEPEAVPELAFTANYYKIRFSNRIALPTESVAILGDPAFESIVTLDPADALVGSLIDDAVLVIDISGPGFTNGGATPADVSVVIDGRVNNTALTRTSGIDLGARYAFRLAENRFELAANVNYIFTFEDQLTSTSLPIETLNTPFKPLRFRGRASLGWVRGGWNANLFVNHAGGYRDERGTRDEPVDSFTTLDFGISYSLEEGRAGWLSGTRISLFAQNLLDTDPPRLLPEPGSTAGLGYDPVNASGRGRFVSLQLRKRW